MIEIFLRETKQLPPFPIYIDGMVRAINQVYQLTPNYLRPQLARKIFRRDDVFYDENIVAVRKDEERTVIIESKERLCVIASSGMLKGGPSALYAEKVCYG